MSKVKNPVSKVKTHTFNGRRYKVSIDDAPLEGLCDQYTKERELIICSDLNTQNGIVTVIHEALHACCWTASEDAVDRTSCDIGRFLWRLGYRT